MRELVLATFAITSAACAFTHTGSGDPPRSTEVPFGAASVEPAAEERAAAPFGVVLAVDLRREIAASDHLAFVVRVDDIEVGRYPIAAAAGRATQAVELPLGDYHLELAYGRTRYAASDFRIADVPTWSGRRVVRLFRHAGTRLDLAARVLTIARWWADEDPAQASVVEWRLGGRVLATTPASGSSPSDPSAMVRDARAFRDDAARSIWRLGERYPVPDVVATTPGTWEARIARAGAPPIAVELVIGPGGAPEPRSGRLVAGPRGWRDAESRPLAIRALAADDAAALVAKLPQPPARQARGLVEPIRVSPDAVRALFRSPRLVDSWTEFLELNATSGYAAQLAKLKELRPQIEKLIKAHGGPWRASELPKS